MPADPHPASELELELTFLADRVPDEVRGTHPVRLVDVYVPEDRQVHPRLRLRQQGDRFELTKKLPVVEGDASQHHELTVTLDDAEFACLAAASGRRVEKDRYRVVIDGHPAEVDVFRGDLQGLVLVDFEFGDRADLESFVAPACCGPDVTQEDFIAGGLLAGRAYAEIEPELDRLGYTRLDV
ncbi:hypothetical protein ACFO3K_19915 [Cellulomonas algicola]|uniref:CYTH domain-containing protein n=1 Tax=Cellulomonas algicola TaxID=2071633 RepID=A0A401V1K4_9CELL|nr:hypothetical protein [Cellulomonas algicola]GCD20784.1 hypothetical protein CTKZ_23460 [Cellulomonas algicola]